MRNILSKVSPRTRRNTIDIPPSTLEVEQTPTSLPSTPTVTTTSHQRNKSNPFLQVQPYPSPPPRNGSPRNHPSSPSEHKTEKLKKDRDFPFKDRDRVKVIYPLQYVNRTGYIVEHENVENKQGLCEVELDYVLNDGDGYEKLTNPTIKRQRITIKNPAKQLKPYKFMKCQKQHFITDMTAESLLKISNIVTYILGFAIIGLLVVMDRTTWNYDVLFYLYCISQSFCIGMGVFCVLILTFIGISIKRLSKHNNLRQLGAVNDDCTSYYWLKSKYWKPRWMFGKDESAIYYILQQIGKILMVFIAAFLVSILIYITDHVEWYLVFIFIIILTGPSMFAVDIIKNGGMLKFI